MYAVRRGKVHELGSHWREALEMRERTNDMTVSLYITRQAVGRPGQPVTYYLPPNLGLLAVRSYNKYHIITLLQAQNSQELRRRK